MSRKQKDAAVAQSVVRRIGSYNLICSAVQLLNAAMAQSVERYLGKVEVTGSIPVGSFKSIENKRFVSI